MKYAFNNNGVLQDVVMSHPSILFPDWYANQFIEVPDNAQNGWLWDGVNATEPKAPEKTPEQLQQEIVAATQTRLDDFAKTRNYDGILSLCTYATDTNPRFAAEGQYGVEARSVTWAKLYEILDEVKAGTRPTPSSFADIESELPVLTWPV